jgi:hypothetical protein
MRRRAWEMVFAGFLLLGLYLVFCFGYITQLITNWPAPD